jgi:hypothetical protein
MSILLAEDVLKYMSISQALCNISRDVDFFKVARPSPNPLGGAPPLVNCPLRFMQYISYRPYLLAVSCIRHLRTCHVVMKRLILHT